jgi:hypothetical protein
MKPTRCKWIALLLGAMISGAVWADQLFNAHYEISVKDRELFGTIRSQFRLKPGEVSKIEILPNNIELSVQAVTAREYDLRMVITPKKGAAPRVRLDRTFRGQFGIPLELDVEADALKVTGAIAVASLSTP